MYHRGQGRYDQGGQDCNQLFEVESVIIRSLKPNGGRDMEKDPQYDGLDLILNITQELNVFLSPHTQWSHHGKSTEK